MLPFVRQLITLMSQSIHSPWPELQTGVPVEMGSPPPPPPVDLSRRWSHLAQGVTSTQQESLIHLVFPLVALEIVVQITDSLVEGSDFSLKE